jgi:acetyl-CoA carboxylase biotin carboxyl carrier protein
MDLLFLEQIIELVGRSPIDELELARDGWRIRLVKAGASAAPGSATASAPAPETSSTLSAPTPPPPASSETVPPHFISAGLGGVFHRAPAPGEPPFVSVGDVVEEGQSLAILEAMKTLIAVEADRPGRIEAVLQVDGASVQAGNPLFKITPADRV